jgi:hypothetical protein
MDYPEMASLHSAPQTLRRAVHNHQAFLAVVALFLTFRLLLPLGFGSIGPDIYDYLRWGSLADSGLYPYVHYWSEYPPLFGWSAILLYRISTLVPALPEEPRYWFVIVLRLTMTLFDAGSLFLVYGMAQQLGTKSRALRTAAFFAGGFIIAYAAAGWYDSIPLFFLLLTLYLALRDHYTSSAVAASIGFLVKLVPLVLVPVVVRRIARLRDAIGYVIAFGVATLVMLLPFILNGSQYLLAFLRGTLNRPSWNSPWAILEGGYTFGAVIPVMERFSPENVNAAPVANPLPWPIIHLAFAAIFLFIYTRRLDWRKPLNTVAFAGLTINLFLLWSKGFSGQFIVYVFPFVVLLLPNWRGLAYAALLSVLWIAEFPLSLLTFATATVEAPNWFIVWIILARTAILIGLCLEYAALMWPRPRVQLALSRIATVAVIVVWTSVLPAGVALLNTYTQVTLAHDPATPAIDLIANSGPGPKTIVMSSNRVYRRLSPAARPVGETLLLPIIKHVPEEVRAKWLDDLAARGSFWFIADEGDPESVEENRKAHAFVSEHVCKVDTQWGGSALVSRFVGRNGAPLPVTTTVRFGDQIELTGAQLYPAMPHAGGTLCVELDWRALKKPAGDYTVFVHLVDPNGQVVAQTDIQPQGGFAPTSQWAAGIPQIDRHGLILPKNLAPGDYTVRLGLYRSDDHTPLRVTQGDNLMPDNLGANLTQISVAP